MRPEGPSEALALTILCPLQHTSGTFLTLLPPSRESSGGIYLGAAAGRSVQSWQSVSPGHCHCMVDWTQMCFGRRRRAGQGPACASELLSANLGLVVMCCGMTLSKAPPRLGLANHILDENVSSVVTEGFKLLLIQEFIQSKPPICRW